MTKKQRRAYGRAYRYWYYAWHPEQIKAQSVAYRKKYPERFKQYVYTWRKRNPKRYKEIIRQSYKKNQFAYSLYTILKRLVQQDQRWN